MARYNLVLDTHKHTYPFQVVEARQGDDKGTTVTAELLRNGVPIDLTGLAVEFECCLPTGEFVRDDHCVIEGNTITHELSTKTLQASGHIGLAYFRVVDGSKTAIESTDGFFINVLPSATCRADVTAYSNRVDMLIAEITTLITLWQKQVTDQEIIFEVNEAERTTAATLLLESISHDFEVAESGRNAIFSAAEKLRNDECSAAATEATEAAKLVHDAIDQEIGPVVDDALATRINIAGGIVGFDEYAAELPRVDDVTIKKDIIDGKTVIRAAPSGSADGDTISETADPETGAKTFSIAEPVMGRVSALEEASLESIARIETAESSIATFRGDMGTVSEALFGATGVR